MSGKLVPRFLNREVAEVVVEEVLRLAMGTESRPSPFGPKRQHCHVVILVPSMENDRAGDYPKWPNYVIEPMALYERSFGNPKEWEHPYSDIARCKALQLWHDRNDDRTDVMPHLLFPGDTPFWGGVKRSGLVAACSGVQSWYDKMIAGMVVDGCVAAAYDAWMTSEEKARGGAFLL